MVYLALDNIGKCLGWQGCIMVRISVSLRGRHWAEMLLINHPDQSP